MQHKPSPKTNRNSQLCKKGKKIQPQLSLSLHKTMNTLSMSFYDDSTIKKKKQVILDLCPIETQHNPSTPKQKRSSRPQSKRSTKKMQPEPKFQLPLGKERDQIDFATTQASKLNPNDEGQRKKWLGQKPKSRQSLSRQKKSHEKYRKQLFLDMLQNRSKTSKGLFDRNQMSIMNRF